MKKIELTKGKYAIVDDEVFDEVSKLKWHYCKGYAQRSERINGKRSNVSMHRYILGANTGDIVDHKDLDGTNNQKSNLRFCTKGQNSENRIKIKSKTTSKYKGVFWNSANKKWISTVKKHSKCYSKIFNNERNAAIWYDETARELFGEFVNTNFTEKSLPLNLSLENMKTSTYRGVIYDKQRGMWRSEIKKDNKTHYLGRFKKESIAAIAYMEKHYELYGDRKTVLFSGKFSIIHPGHMATIMKLARNYGSVKVIILDYPERKTTIDYALRVFKSIFDNTVLDISFFVSPIHFGSITRSEIDEFKPFDLYASGNMSVLKHIEEVGVPTIYEQRSFSYEASKIELPE